MGPLWAPEGAATVASSGQIAVPRLPRRVVARPRLLSRVHHSIGGGLTVVRAPAGSGKSTFLAMLARDLEFEAHWLSLDETSSAPEVLAHQLGAALAGATSVRRPPTATKASDLQAFVSAALFEAASRAPVPLLLVVDNVDLLGHDRDAVELLGWLVDSLPEGHEVILSGRDIPFISSVNSRVATGEVLVLEGPDLLFDDSELAAAIAITSSGGSPDTLRGQTGGWPVGVMAALAAPARGDAPQDLAAGAFDRYLEAEVWASAPPGLQEMLFRLSLRPSVRRPAVEAEFGRQGWRELSAWVAGRDFLCEHLSPAEFRLNPMLRRFIMAEFERRDPDAYDDALDRVIDAALNGGDIAEALELARSCGTEPQLARIIEKHGPQLLIQGSFALLNRAFERVSLETLSGRPLVRALRARAMAHAGDPELALDEAEALLHLPGVTGAARVHAQLARVRALRLTGRTDEAIEAAEQLRLIEWCGSPALHAEVTYHRAELQLSAARNFARAAELLEQAIALADEHAVSPLGLLARSTLGQALAMRGDAPGAVTVLTRSAQGWRRLGRSSNLGWVLNNLGMAHLDAGDFRSAVAVLQEAVDEGIACGNHRNVAYATASLGDAEIARGNFGRAREHFEEAIRICATSAIDETLAALSIAGLSAAFLGEGDTQQADFYSRRAMLVALSSANPFEVATCRLQQAAVELAAGNHVAAINEAAAAAQQFVEMDIAPSVAVAYYRLAMAQFKANHRTDAQDSLALSAAAVRQPWMASVLVPLVRENPMFAQWAASRARAGAPFREILERQSFTAGLAADAGDLPLPARLPPVVSRSLGRVSVTVGGREVSDEQWSSARARELFFLFLANRDGLRKEEAVEYLYPDLPREKCNSAFHSNLYRVRKALYQDSVVKREGTYVLNPEGVFEWDVEQFEAALERGRQAPAGSLARAQAFQQALELYGGPFAQTFENEWAASRRHELDSHAHEALATLGGYFAGREDYESAAMCMERLLRADRYNEEAAFALARYRSRAGQTVQALRFIDEYAAQYESELGEPVPERFVDLRAAIASGVAV